MTAPHETADRVVAALLEWRAWRERTARRFAEPAPPPHASPEDRSRHPARACLRLVTYALNSGAEGGWYGEAARLLGGLTATGMDAADLARFIGVLNHRRR
ncbi:hypothetical protein AB6O49_33745 [Streptomyces sp. SBR177]